MLQGVLNSCNFLWEVPGAGPCCLHQGLSQTPLFFRSGHVHMDSLKELAGQGDCRNPS